MSDIGTSRGLPPAPAGDNSGLVGDDRPCVSCGYNVRGLPADGACPECGTPIPASLHGRLLRYASPGYLAMLHRGAVVVETAIAAQAVMVMAAVFLPWFTSRAGAPAWLKAVAIAADGVTTALSVLGLIGWWMLSSRDPGEGPEAPGRITRIVLRWAVAAQLAAALGSLVVGAVLSGTRVTPGTRTLLTVQSGIDWAQALAWVVAFFAGLTYLRHLALRIPNRTLAARTDGLRTFATVLVAAVVVVAGVLVVLTLLLQGSSAMAVVGVLTGMAVCFGIPVLGVVTLVAFIMYVLLIDQVRAALGAERRPVPTILMDPGGK